MSEQRPAAAVPPSTVPPARRVTAASAITRAELDAARLQLALEIARIGSFDWNLVANHLHWSDELIRMWGENPATFQPTYEDFLMRLHPEDREPTQRAIEKALAGGDVYEREYRFSRPDGQRRRWLARGRVLRDAHRTALAMVGMVVDVTETRSAQEQVIRTLETVLEAFFAVDRQWRFTYVNARAELLLEASRDELVGRNVWEVFSEAVGSEFQACYERVMRTGEPDTVEAFYEPLNRIFQARAFADPDGITVYFTDVTAQRRMEAELAALAEQSERARAEAEEARSMAELAREETERAANRLAFLAAATELVTSSLDREEVLKRLTALAVPLLADWASVYLIDGTEIRRVAIAHADEHKQARAESLVGRFNAPLEGSSLAATTARLGRPQLLSTTSEARAAARRGGDEFARVAVELGLASGMAVPLATHGRVLGAMTFARGEHRPAYTDDDLDLAAQLAARASIAVLNAELFEREHGLALALQRAILPPRTPGLPSLEIGVHYLPASAGVEVGGDWYDSLPLPDGRVGLVVGDVVGHGLQAASIMGQLRNALRAFALDGDDPDIVVRRLNRLLLHTEPDALATLVYVVYDPRSRQFAWCNAGHLPPLVRDADGEVHYLEELHGPVIGAIGDARYEMSTAGLDDRELLVLFTDGLVEDRERPITAGLEDLRAAVAAFDQDSDATTLAADVARLALGSRRRDDDVCVLVARSH